MSRLTVSPKAKRVTKILSAYIDRCTEEILSVDDVDPARVFFLRPSSFPYCGLRRLLEAPKVLEQVRSMSLASSYFTEVGTTTHTVFQKYLGRGGRIVGDWKCKHCGKFTKFHTFRECSCGFPPSYRELEVKYKRTVIGHVDKLFQLEPAKKRKSPFVIGDYKTTSTSKIQLNKKKKVFPYLANVSQVEMYVPLLEACFDISVDYWMLLYLARDAPFRWGRYLHTVEITPERKKVLRKRLDRWVKVHRRVLTADTVEDAQVIQKYKLCKSKDDYMANWHDEYKACPYVDVCFTKDMDKVVRTSMKHKVYPLIQHAPKRIRQELEL